MAIVEAKCFHNIKMTFRAGEVDEASKYHHSADGIEGGADEENYKCLRISSPTQSIFFLKDLNS